MVVHSQPAVTLDSLSLIPNRFTINNPSVQIPVVDLSHPEAKFAIVKACEEFGFFKVVNHSVRFEYMNRLEDEAVRFFALSQAQKDRAGPPDPFGYGSKRIGPNGDVGWIEYILLNTDSQFTSVKTQAVFKENPEVFRTAVENYTAAVKGLACTILDMMAEGLGVFPSDELSRMVRDERSDSCLRLNHYPESKEKMKKVGFGEHTDPQIISVLRSNNTSGLQICVKDEGWIAVPPDHSSFFINVGDALQVMTNGRFKSVKHRVMADTKRSRVSMVYFGGPPLTQKITALPCLVPNEEDRLYNDFVWSEYKSSAYKSRLGDYRLRLFEKDPQFVMN